MEDQLGQETNLGSLILDALYYGSPLRPAAMAVHGGLMMHDPQGMGRIVGNAGAAKWQRGQPPAYYQPGQQPAGMSQGMTDEDLMMYGPQPASLAQRYR